MRHIIILILFVFCPAVYAATIHVPGDYPTIQDGIDAAVNGDTVLVASGTYIENISFNGKAITLISEQGAEHTFIDGNNAGSVVIFDDMEGPDSVLDGFTLFNGNAHRGGGIFCGAGVSPTISNNKVVDNFADGGGGMYNDTGSAPAVVNCVFEQNEAYTTAGGKKGGGIGNHYSNAEVTGCTFIANASSYGGAISNFFGSPVITNCTFIENRALGWFISLVGHWGGVGGAIYNDNSNGARVANCLFIDNVAEKEWLWEIPGSGGAVANTSLPSCSVEFVNCTFYGNLAENAGPGGGIYNGFECDMTVTNCILWDNVPSEIDNSLSSTATVTFSCIEGGYSGTGNITDAPLFADPGNNDFHLTYDSPCRDAGDNSVVTDPNDFEGDPRIAHGTVDMGADEFYNHLYCTGDFSPNGSIEGKFVGLPATMPVGLFIGSGIMDPPLQHKWGEFYLDTPWLLFPLVPIPADGILEIPVTLPGTSGPYDIPMQALIGWELSNLFVLKVN